MTFLHQLDALTTPSDSDIIYVVTGLPDSPVSRKMTIADLFSVQGGAGVLVWPAGGATLTIPATGTVALLGAANVFTAAQKINVNSATALVVEQGGVHDNTLLVNTASGWIIVPKLGIQATPEAAMALTFAQNDVIGVNGDTGYLAISAANVFDHNYGAALIFNGVNRLSSSAGGVEFYAGNVSTGHTRFFTGNAVERLRLTYSGNVGVNTLTPGGSSTVGTGIISLGNGTAPVGGVANQVSLYSADTAGSAELFALDEAGNTPQLTPHPSDFLDTLPTLGREYPWAYTAENRYLGKKISVDMAGAIRAIEKLSGEKFIYLEDLEKLDWDAGQESQAILRQHEIAAAKQDIENLDELIAAESDAGKKADLQSRRNIIMVPPPYTKKKPPGWMANRGVKTRL